MRRFDKKLHIEHVNKLVLERSTITEEYTDLTSEDLDWAEDYLNKGKKTDWENFLILDVTGKLGVYYTLWHFIKPPPMSRQNPLNFKQNMAMDFKRAVQNLKIKYPNRFVVFDNGRGTNSLFLRNSFMFPFGKYKNQDIRDVAKTDERYVLWAGGDSRDIRGYTNIEVYKDPNRGGYKTRNLKSEKEKNFIKNLKEFKLVLDLKELGVTDDNKDEASTTNKTKFADLLRVLHEKLNNYQDSSFIENFTAKIERGADTSKFSDKVNGILAQIYSNSFDKAIKFQKEDEMLGLLTNRTIEKKESLNLVAGEKYEKDLKFIKQEIKDGQFGVQNVLIFSDENGNNFINFTTSEINLNPNEIYKVRFTFKVLGNYQGNRYYYIIRVKIL